MSDPSDASGGGFRRIYLLPISLAFLAIFNGVPAAVVAANGDPPPSTVVCSTYYEDIGQLVEQGLDQSFREWNEPDLEDRCGQAHDIARDWLDGPDAGESGGSSGSFGG